MDYKGLAKKEAEDKLKEYGPNEIRETSFSGPFKILLRQIRHNIIIYLLIIAAALSFFVGKSLTAYVILVVIFIVVLTGFIQEYRAEKVINSLKSMLMPVSIVIRDGKEIEISSREIVPGDLIALRTGEKIPADCVLVEQKDLLVNESILTGESKEIGKRVQSKETQSDENLIFMGTFIVNGKCIAKVMHTGMNTRFGKIAGLISTAEKELPLQKKVNRISKFMIINAIVFSIITGIVILAGKPFSEDLLVDTLVLTIALCVAAFPEGFPVVLTTALSSGAYRMAQQNAIVNRMSIIETLGETTVICSDKTGTLTKGEMTVKKLFLDNRIITVTGIGYEGNGSFFENNKKISIDKEKTFNELIRCAVLCNDSKIERTGEDKIFRIFGTPTEASLKILAAKANLYLEDLQMERAEEIPFNSERKIMSVLCKSNKENLVFTKGAPEYVLRKCNFIQRDDGIFRLTEREKSIILKENMKMNSEGLRSLAFAYKKTKSLTQDHFEEELVFIGMTGIEDPPREEIKEALKLCLNSGISVKMITGDNKDTAIAISKQIGLAGKVMEGSELDNYSEEELSKIVHEIVIFARVKPEHKLKIVKALKMNGEIVTMTGDGVNDAPALKEAHIGVAMGKNGTDVSRSVADLTLKDDNFATIVYAIKEGRTIFKNIRKFTSYLLSCKVTELSILLVGVLLSPFFGWPIPLLLAIQILFMNLVTDDLPAITLAVTPQSNDVMEERPRKKKEILNKDLVIWFAISGVLMAALTLSVFYVTFNVLGLDFLYARTTALLTLILVEIGNAYNFISFRKPFSLGALKVNKYLLGASALSILATALIIYTPLNVVFATAPIGLAGWILGILSAIFLIIIFNFLKRLNSRSNIFEINNF